MRFLRIRIEIRPTWLCKIIGISKMKGLKQMVTEKVKRIQELRRSNAASAIPSKKKYSRKQKYKNKFD